MAATRNDKKLKVSSDRDAMRERIAIASTKMESQIHEIIEFKRADSADEMAQDLKMFHTSILLQMNDDDFNDNDNGNAFFLLCTNSFDSLTRAVTNDIANIIGSEDDDTSILTLAKTEEHGDRIEERIKYWMKVLDKAKEVGDMESVFAIKAGIKRFISNTDLKDRLGDDYDQDKLNRTKYGRVKDLRMAAFDTVVNENKKLFETYEEVPVGKKNATQTDYIEENKATIPCMAPYIGQLEFFMQTEKKDRDSNEEYKEKFEEFKNKLRDYKNDSYEFNSIKFNEVFEKLNEYSSKLEQKRKRTNIEEAKYKFASKVLKKLEEVISHPEILTDPRRVSALYTEIFMLIESEGKKVKHEWFDAREKSKGNYVKPVEMAIEMLDVMYGALSISKNLHQPIRDTRVEMELVQPKGKEPELSESSNDEDLGAGAGSFNDVQGTAKIRGGETYRSKSMDQYRDQDDPVLVEGMKKRIPAPEELSDDASLEDAINHFTTYWEIVRDNFSRLGELSAVAVIDCFLDALKNPDIQPEDLIEHIRDVGNFASSKQLARANIMSEQSFHKMIPYIHTTLEVLEKVLENTPTHAPRQGA